MAGAKSKSGRKSGGGRKKGSSKSGRSAASRSRAGVARRKSGAVGRRKASASKGGRKTGSRKTSARKTTARKTSPGSASRAGAPRTGTARTAARTSSLAPGQRGRKSRASQVTDGQTNENQFEGEGSYTASHRFRKAEADFIKRNRRNIAKLGKEAEAALEGREGNELRQAEEEARSHSAGDDEE